MFMKETLLSFDLSQADDKGGVARPGVSRIGQDLRKSR
jgi:hypothetical protein